MSRLLRTLFPDLNTSIETAGDGSQEIVAFAGISLGFAAQTDRGLMVPSIRNADKLNARELDAEIRRLTAVVREGKATPEELGSGTLNNYGVFGVDGSAATINHPRWRSLAWAGSSTSRGWLTVNWPCERIAVKFRRTWSSWTGGPSVLRVRPSLLANTEQIRWLLHSCATRFSPALKPGLRARRR